MATSSHSRDGTETRTWDVIAGIEKIDHKLGELTDENAANEEQCSFI